LFSFYDKYSIRSEIGAYTENNGFSLEISLDRTIKQINVLNILPTKLHLDIKYDKLIRPISSQPKK
jgi:hypothetical protein